MNHKEIKDVNTHKFEIETINAADVLFWSIDIKNLLFFMSNKSMKILGYNENDLNNSIEDWKNILHADEMARIDRVIRTSIDSNQDSFTILQRFRHKNGRYHWYYSQGTMNKNTHGKIESVSGFSANADEIVQIYQHLSAEEEIYLDYINVTNTATWYWNIPTGESRYNNKWAEMIGYTLEELEPIDFQTWIKHIHPDDLEKANHALNLTLSGKNDFYEHTSRMVHKDGSDVWVQDRGKVISWTREGKPLIMVGTHTDITELKKLELQHMKDEEKYRNLVDSSYDIIFTVNLRGEFAYLSPAWNRLLGYDMDEAISKSFKLYVHPEDLQRVSTFFKDIRKTNAKSEISAYKLIHKNGTYRWFTTNGASLKDEKGNIIGFSGTARDVTRQKKLEEQLSKERDLFKKTLLSVGDAIISTNKKGQVVMMNPVAQTLLGVKEKASIGKDLMDVFIIENKDLMSTIKNMSLDTTNSRHSIQPSEAVLIHKNGERSPIEYSASLIVDYEKVEDGVVIVFRDITERKERLDEIEYLSYHDYMTGFYNRRYFEQLIKELDKKETPLGMMLLDIDDLKKFNDTFGHDAGDQLIKKVSKVIEDVVVDGTVCRIGGDEFIIIYQKQIDLSKVEKEIKEKLKLISLFGRAISVSVGYNSRLDKYDRLADVQKRADQYLYACKKKYHSI